MTSRDWQEHCLQWRQTGALAEIAACLNALPSEVAHSLAGCQWRAYLANAQQDLPRAELALREMLVLAPQANTHLLLASNLHKQQCYAEAQAILLHLLQLEPHLWVAKFNLAQSYLAEGDIQAALPLLTQCLQGEPEHSELLFQLAAIHCQLDQPDHAKNYLTRLLTLEPYHVEGLNNLGACHLKVGDHVAAIHCFATAMRVDEQHLPARSNLAVALLRENRYQEALVHFEQYLTLAPEDVDALYHAGVAASMQGELDRALDYFQQVLANKAAELTVLVPSLLNLASIALKKNEPSNAIGFYQRVIALEPLQAIATYMLAALLGNALPDKAPEAYVSALFDQYAAHFDQHLVTELAYQTPQQLRKLYDRVVKKTALLPPFHLLDLGCGTGLSGAAFLDVASPLTGVDLSSQMLTVARAKGFYQNLVEADIIAYLEQDGASFEIILAADVVVYLGDLADFLRLSAKRLVKGGLLLFSLETAALNVPFKLTTTGRFQHQLADVLAQGKAHGLRCLAKEQVTLRTQAKQAVIGTIIALQKQ